jgi:signal transduction histidine kinase
VPLVLGDRCPGVIGFTFDRPRRFAPAERAFVETLAQLSAQAFERARLFEAEQEARRDAERIGQLQQQLMSVVGHDLRTPLAAIRMSSAGLLRRPGLPPDQERALRRIVNGAERMSGILRDLLDLARTRRGLTIAIHRDSVDLGDVAREAVVDFEDPDVPARVVVETEGDLCVAGDAGRLSQVISNLVGNALQHGGGAPVRLHARGGEGEVVLEIHNRGLPIPPALLPEVFEPFRRGPGHGDRAGSVGLGLFIVREVVRAHGGTVEVRSDAASGTTFTVRLPRQAPPGG